MRGCGRGVGGFGFARRADPTARLWRFLWSAGGRGVGMVALIDAAHFVPRRHAACATCCGRGCVAFLRRYPDLAVATPATGGAWGAGAALDRSNFGPQQPSRRGARGVAGALDCPPPYIRDWGPVGQASTCPPPGLWCGLWYAGCGPGCVRARPGGEIAPRSPLDRPHLVPGSGSALGWPRIGPRAPDQPRVRPGFARDWPWTLDRPQISVPDRPS